MDRIICDASPLIILAKSDLLELLPGQFAEVIVPQAGLYLKRDVIEAVQKGILEKKK